ncbi:DNA-binding protein [Clostridium boliviensis]|uniref:DNA-binding protein n=1 Tax=Clostridium boliviensis TaxID=318465 RepID=A0ABU4GMW4_9CLOT|nr:helix-turn-helix domain-containing protein [Clostridium boliviensis]MDW2798965.1 DNA-binding protein [Clostridium boliviensis]
MFDYISVKQASDKWGISKRRIQKLCEENRINGVVRFGRVWAIPKDAPKPADSRLKENRKKGR